MGKTKSVHKGPRPENKCIQAIRTQCKYAHKELWRAKMNNEPQSYIDLINSRILNQEIQIQDEIRVCEQYKLEKFAETLNKKKWQNHEKSLWVCQ